MPKKPDPKTLKTRPDLGDQEWLVWLASQPENRGINVIGLYGKMLEWCASKHGITPTRRRLLRWLDNEREAIPMLGEPIEPDCSQCDNERRVRGVDFTYPCPTCRKKECDAFWRVRGR